MTTTKTSYALVIRHQGPMTALAGYDPLPISEVTLKKLIDLPGIREASLPRSNHLRIRREAGVEWGAEIEDAVLGILRPDLGTSISLVEAAVFNLYNRDPHVISVDVGRNGGTIRLSRYAYEPGAAHYDRDTLETIATALDAHELVAISRWVVPGSIEVRFRDARTWKDKQVRDAVRHTLEEMTGRAIVFNLEL